MKKSILLILTILISLTFFKKDKVDETVAEGEPSVISRKEVFDVKSSFKSEEKNSIGVINSKETERIVNKNKSFKFSHIDGLREKVCSRQADSTHCRFLNNGVELISEEELSFAEILNSEDKNKIKIALIESILKSKDLVSIRSLIEKMHGLNPNNYRTKELLILAKSKELLENNKDDKNNWQEIQVQIEEAYQLADDRESRDKLDVIKIMLEIKMDDYSSAQSSVEDSLIKNPKSAKLQYMKSYFEFKDGNREESIDSLIKIVKENPDFLPALKALSVIQDGGVSPFALSFDIDMDDIVRM